MSDFVAVLEQFNAPPLFARWAAAFAIGAAVQRRVWLLSFDEKIYPNFYLMFVGPSGAGKGVVLNPLTAVLSKVPDQYIAPASLTSAAIADELADSPVVAITKNGNFNYNALTVISREMGVFLPTYDGTMLNLLTDVFDGKGYSERRRGRDKKLEIPEAHLAIVGGTTPAWLNNVLPEGAWSEGFMSRMVCVFSGGQEKREITETVDFPRKAAYARLGKDLAAIAARTGRISWEPKALRALNDWMIKGKGKPYPTHPKLISYLERRIYNALKLCLCFCLSRHGESISTIDVEMTQELMLETETVMGEIFKAMRTGGDASIIEEAWHFLYTKFVRTTKPVPRHLLVQFLAERTPSYNIQKIIEAMEAGKLILRHEVKSAGDCFEPLSPGSD